MHPVNQSATPQTIEHSALQSPSHPPTPMPRATTSATVLPSPRALPAAAPLWPVGVAVTLALALVLVPERVVSPDRLSVPVGRMGAPEPIITGAVSVGIVMTPVLVGVDDSEAGIVKPGVERGAVVMGSETAAVVNGARRARRARRTGVEVWCCIFWGGSLVAEAGTIRTVLFQDSIGRGCLHVLW